MGCGGFPPILGSTFEDVERQKKEYRALYRKAKKTQRGRLAREISGSGRQFRIRVREGEHEGKYVVGYSAEKGNGPTFTEDRMRAGIFGSDNDKPDGLVRNLITLQDTLGIDVWHEEIMGNEWRSGHVGGTL